MSNKLTIVISEDRAAHSAEQTIEKAVLNGLAAGPQLEVALLPHLYDLAPEGPGMQYLQSIDGGMIVLAWLYPRAIYWLLDANRIQGRMGATSFFPEEELAPPPAAKKGKREAVADRTIWCIDLRGHEEAESLLAEIDRVAQQVLGVPVTTAVAAVGVGAASAGHARIQEGTRPRWYPVVDYQRCGQCMECLNFCLFGVFSVDEAGTLWVEQPDACRDGCPACSRVCPMGAIMFPEHNNPAIAGSHKASTNTMQLEIVPFFGTADAASLAAAEQKKAVREKEKVGPPTGGPADPRQPPKKADLDGLVDELDKADL